MKPLDLSNDSIDDVLSVAEAVLHDPQAPARFAVPLVRRAWVLTLGETDDLAQAIAGDRRLSRTRRIRFGGAWARGEGPNRDEMLAQVRVLRRMTGAPDRRTLLASAVLLVVALLAVLLLRIAAGSVAMHSGVPLGRWRVEVFAIKEFRGPSVAFRAADASFEWKGPPHETMPKDKFATRLSTCLEIDAPTKIEFVLFADDGARLFVDGTKQINAWSKKGKARRKTLTLQPGTHPIVVEHHDKKGTAKIHLTASIDGAQPAPLPARMLRYSATPGSC